MTPDQLQTSLYRTADALPDARFLELLLWDDRDDPVSTRMLTEIAASGCNVGAIIRETRIFEPGRKADYLPNIDRTRTEDEQWPEHVAWTRRKMGEDAPMAKVYEIALRRMWGMPMPPWLGSQYGIAEEVERERAQRVDSLRAHLSSLDDTTLRHVATGDTTALPRDMWVWLDYLTEYIAADILATRQARTAV